MLYVICNGHLSLYVNMNCTAVYLATHDVLLKISGEWEVAIERFLKKEKGSQRKSRNKAVGGCGGKTF